MYESSEATKGGMHTIPVWNGSYITMRTERKRDSMKDHGAS